VATEDIEQLAERLRTIESNLRRVLQSVNLEWMEPTPTDGVPPEVIELIKNGDRVGATKRYRELTGASLGEANDVVSKIAL
jgi:ribosomal protein L7/L12